MTMTLKLVQIGNSRGVRIPKAIIEQCGLGDEVEVEAREGELVLRSPKSVRSGWDAAFLRMRARNDDRLLDENSIARPTEWEQTQWKW